MILNPPDKSQVICQKLLRGYQFSESDMYSVENEPLYGSLRNNFEWFRDHLAAVGFTLREDDRVFFLEKEDKGLSLEEKQTVVLLFLLSDLWMEKGRAFGDLFQMRVEITGHDWFRDGYGREYLLQVGVEDASQLEEIFKKMSRKGLTDYFPESQSITLRKPAERIINMAREVHIRMKREETEKNE